MNANELEKSVVGQVIAGKYRVDSVLGSGGMGVVLAATHLDLGRVVAVKLMRTELADHPWAVDRLLREAKLAAQFRGEHVCRVLDVGTVSDGAPYIVMEYLEGSDLATLLNEHGRFEIESAVDYVLQTAEALAEAHAASIVHRDLKPENLFVARQLDGTPIIKVLDFGISKQVGALSLGRVLTNPSAALGSPFYMAPEQMRSARDVDQRADLWALGAILFELLSGRQPFQGDSLPEVCAAVMSAEPPRVSELRPEVPEELADAVARCLEKEPDRRFATVLELARAIAPFGAFDASLSLERIERVLERRSSTFNGSLSTSSLMTRSSSTRLTPSGARLRIPSAAATLDASPLPAPEPEPSAPSRPPRRYLAWLATFTASAALGLAALFLVPRALHAPPTHAAVAALTVAHEPSAAASPSVVNANAPTSVAPTSVAPTSVAPASVAPTSVAPASVALAADLGAPVSAAAPSAGPAPRVPPHPTAHVARVAPRAQPAHGKPAPASAAPAASPDKKAPDLAAAWDTSSFGPRH